MALSRGGGEVAPHPAVCLRPQLPGLPGRLNGPEAPGPARLLRSAGTRRGCRVPQPERKRAALQDSGCWGPQPLPGGGGRPVVGSGWRLQLHRWSAAPACKPWTLHLKLRRGNACKAADGHIHDY